MFLPGYSLITCVALVVLPTNTAVLSSYLSSPHCTGREHGENLTMSHKTVEYFKIVVRVLGRN